MRFNIPTILWLTLILLVVDWMFESVVIEGFWWTVASAAVFIVINISVKKVVLRAVLPLRWLTLNIGRLFVNALMLLLLDYVMGSHFVVVGFWNVFWATFVISVLSVFCFEVLGIGAPVDKDQEVVL